MIYFLKKCSLSIWRVIGLLIFIAVSNELAFAQKAAAKLSVTGADSINILNQIEHGTALIQHSPKEALSIFEQSLVASEAAKFNKGIGLSNARLARWYFGNNVGLSITLANRALLLLEANRKVLVDDVADMHLLLAEAYDEQGKKDSSAYYYYLLGEEMEAGNITDAEFAVKVFTKLTIFWVNLDNIDPLNEEYKTIVRRFLDKAKLASLQIKDSADARSSIYFIQGAYQHALHQYDSARFFYKKYIVERESLKKLNVVRKISTLYNIADTYLQEKKPVEALKYINEIKEIGKDPQNAGYLAFYLSILDLLTAKSYFQLQEYNKTISILDKALADLQLTGTHFRNEVVESYDIYASSFEALGNYKKALEYKNIYIKLHDSLARTDRINIISRLEIRNRMASKDKELAVQKLTLSEIENKIKNRNFWLIAILFLALSGVLIFILWRKKNIDKQNLQEQSINNLQQKIKIEKLNASINGEEKERTRIGRELHDGIGGLLSVARMNFELAKKVTTIEANNDFSDGVKLLEEATVELRKAAYNLMPEVLLTQGLACAVQVFCEKMMSKSATGIKFQAIGKEPNLSNAFALPVYRVIQELVHNIIKHANAKHALVQLNFQQSGIIDITVEDDGIGINSHNTENPMSMGLKNLKERIEDLGGKLDIQSSPEAGSSIYLEFESFEEKTQLHD